MPTMKPSIWRGTKLIMSRCGDVSVSSSQIDNRQRLINGYLRLRTLEKNVSRHKRHIIRLQRERLISKQEHLEYVPEENTV